ncbi:MAG: Flp pilus assembly complex ATPase component TadA [Fibrobacterota bacterium]|nr:Flp pilus assembly complex ATPase component TadA [Fibrobacterota bacterium]QQS07399.1 MAG: Flp pilus assembly complex ATPase component TadA [Fibrobacterota bacterium]
MSDPTPPRKPKMLGERLLEAGLLSSAQLQLALREQKRKGGFLGEILERFGFVKAEAVSRLLADDAQAGFVDVVHAVIDAEVLSLIPLEIAHKHQLIPLARDGQILTVAMADTFDVVAIDAVERITGLGLEVLAAPAQAIQDAISQKYVQGESLDDLVDAALSASIVDVAEAGRIAPLVRLVDQVIALSVRRRATDIHLEPEEGMVRVRLRIDGVLHQEAILPKPLQGAIIARLKILAGLDVTEHRVPQDGRIAFSIGRRRIDLRVSTLPTQYGESVVMRVLDKSNVLLDLDLLGIREADRARFQLALRQPHGVILVTGPTGSGKTTTLYAALGQIDAIQRSVFTLEDPVEYSLPMIRQTQIQAEQGMTFAAGLRALLRQDPDVILVGEVRDEETAQLATRAALTGHLVFSTLHTNTSAGAVSRLVDMGVEPYLLSSALVAVLAQRLVRKICPHCAKEDPDSVETLVSRGLVADPNGRYRKGQGCDSCFGLGTLGRLAIYEVLLVDGAISKAIRDGSGEDRIRECARSGGMTSMLDDGLAKAALGIVHVDDVLRAVG